MPSRIVRFIKGGIYYPPAIDIGTYSAKLVQVDRRGAGYKVVTYGEVTYGEQIFVGTEIIDRYALVEHIRELTAEAGVKDRDVVIHIPSSACFYSVITVPQTKTPEEAVMNYIQGIFPPEEFPRVKVGFRVLPLSMEANAVDIAIAAVKKDFLDERVSVVSEAGFTPVVIDVEPAVISNQFYFNHPEATNVPVCTVDVGASFTKIIISYGGYPYTVRTLELGGFLITEQLQREFVLLCHLLLRRAAFSVSSCQ